MVSALFLLLSPGGLKLSSLDKALGQDPLRIVVPEFFGGSDESTHPEDFLL